MRANICFGSFLLLLNIAPFLLPWYKWGTEDTLPLAIFILVFSIVTFLFYICSSKTLTDDMEIEAKDDIKELVRSFKTMFFAMLSVNLLIGFLAAIAGQGSGIVMVAVIPITILIFVSYLLYALICYPILGLLPWFKKKINKNDSTKQ